MSGTESERKPALTSRRGFVLGTSLSIVSVYGVWAVYGAAPFDVRGDTAQVHDDPHAGHALAPPEAGHDGHGGRAGGKAEAIEKFRRETEAFMARHRQADGTVAVLPAAAGHSHEGHGAAPARELDVYLLVQRWSLEPGMLRLARGQRYRLRMMAADVAHGASIQAGRGSAIVRLRPGIAVERGIAFRSPGRYLVYCTTYCGAPHDRMWSTIQVA